MVHIFYFLNIQIDIENTACSVAMGGRHCSFLGRQKPLKIQKRKATDQITK